MSVKNRIATIIGMPVASVELFDIFVTNMPRFLEGGLIVAGIGVAALGWQGTRKLIHTATADEQAPVQAEQVTAAPQEAQELPAGLTVQQLGAVPTREEEVQQAFMRGAAAAMQRSRQGIER